MFRLLFMIVLAVTVSGESATAEPDVGSAGTYQLHREGSSVHWKINQVGLSKFTGRFTRFDATLVIDPAKPENAKLAVSIDPTSIRTDFLFADRFDRELVEDENFFNSVKFPRITFTSTRIERSGAKAAIVAGDLTLLGIVRPLILDVRLNAISEPHMGRKPAIRFTASARIKRSEFGVVTRTFIADEILLMVEAEFIKL